MSSPKPWQRVVIGVIAARLTRVRAGRPPKAEPGGRTGRGGAAPGHRQTIRRGRYRAAGHELRCLPGACGCGCWRGGTPASAEPRVRCGPGRSRRRPSSGTRSRPARPEPSSARQHQAPTGASRRARDARRRTRSVAAADQDRPAAVTAATAGTPLQITCPRRSPGPAAITEKTPKNGLEITAGMCASPGRGSITMREQEHRVTWRARRRDRAVLLFKRETAGP
jgi:hypothetical protein